MKFNSLDKIKGIYFSYQDVAKAFGISEKAAIVKCTRYVKSGIFIRLKRNFYVKRENWKYLSVNELFEIANLIQVPSYISLTTAMSFYEITTQIQRDFFESISIKRTISYEISGRVFSYSKLKQDLYYGSINKENYFDLYY